MANEDFTNQQTILVSELLIKVSSLENLILTKGLATKEEIDIETKKVVEQLTKLVEANIKKQAEEIDQPK